MHARGHASYVCERAAPSAKHRRSGEGEARIRERKRGNFARILMFARGTRVELESWEMVKVFVKISWSRVD